MRVAGLLFLALAAAAAAAPLAHSHNDYEQSRPLHDALANGFDSVEADVWLADGRLLVAHEREQVRADRTLQALYLDPLRVHLRSGAARPLILLIDVKTEAAATWRAVDAALAEYPDLAGKVRFIISGNRDRAALMASPRPAAMDGRSEDLADAATAEWIPLVSDNWAKFFAWRGEGEFPAAERAKLIELVAQAHAQRRLLRFWNTPNRPEVWRVLRDAGVDIIGTDHLTGLRQFLNSP